MNGGRRHISDIANAPKPRQTPPKPDEPDDQQSQGFFDATHGRPTPPRPLTKKWPVSSPNQHIPPPQSESDHNDTREREPRQGRWRERETERDGRAREREREKTCLDVWMRDEDRESIHPKSKSNNLMGVMGVNFESCEIVQSTKYSSKRPKVQRATEGK